MQYETMQSKGQRGNTIPAGYWYFNITVDGKSFARGVNWHRTEEDAVKEAEAAGLERAS